MISYKNIIANRAYRDVTYDGSNLEKYNYVLLEGLSDVLYAMEPKSICYRFGDDIGRMVTYDKKLIEGLNKPGSTSLVGIFMFY